jgi:glyoxylase-like metal-dependent hydrolase (beta-lactamase superfamily II)
VTWQQLSEGVFCRRYEPWDVSVGVVVGAAGVLVVDTRANAEEGDELAADLREIDPRPPRWIVNTHDHFDHLGGNASFPEAEVVDHDGTIDLGDRCVTVRHLGLAHTARDLVVAVPDASVTFAGDLVEQSGPPAYGDDSYPLDWPATNARLLGTLGPTDRVVPGHGEVVDRRFVAAQLKELETVARTIRHLWVGEVPLADAANSMTKSLGSALADAVARGYWQLDVSAERGSGG